MKRLFNGKLFVGLMALVMMIGVGSAIAQKPVLKKKPVTKKKVVAKPAEPLFTVDTGTVIRTRMNRTISSKTAKVGDSFTVTVTEPVYASNGTVVIPTGSILTGRVNAVTPAAKGGKAGTIEASFIQAKLPNGRTRSINGSLTDLVNSDNEGTATGKEMEHRKLIFIGGGAGGGLILGAAIGGGKGAAIGGLLGAGAGFLGERYTKGSEAEVRSGTEFGVLMNQTVTLPKFAEITPVNQ